MPRTKKAEKETMNDLILKTMEENQKFFESNPDLEKIFSEIVMLTDDALEHIPKSTVVSTKQIFSFHGFTPISVGIYISFLTGNITSCFMQLRLLVEFFAFTSVASRLYPEDDTFTQLKKVRKKYKNNISGMIKRFNLKAWELWKSLSNWLHARTYSVKVIRNVINNEMTLGSIVQPATYDKNDIQQLLELKRQVRTFRKILKKVN